MCKARRSYNSEARNYVNWFSRASHRLTCSYWQRRHFMVLGDFLKSVLLLCKLSTTTQTTASGPFALNIGSALIDNIVKRIVFRLWLERFWKNVWNKLRYPLHIRLDSAFQRPPIPIVIAKALWCWSLDTNEPCCRQWRHEDQSFDLTCLIKALWSIIEFDLTIPLSRLML